jgi:hypothetical protein
MLSVTPSGRRQGVGGESNPPLRGSQPRVQRRYTTNTIGPPLAPPGRGVGGEGERKERESNPQGRVRAQPRSRRFPSPIGWPFRN